MRYNLEDGEFDFHEPYLVYIAACGQFHEREDCPRLGTSKAITDNLSAKDQGFKPCPECCLLQSQIDDFEGKAHYAQWASERFWRIHEGVLLVSDRVLEPIPDRPPDGYTLGGRLLAKKFERELWSEDEQKHLAAKKNESGEWIIPNHRFIQFVAEVKEAINEEVRKKLEPSNRWRYHTLFIPQGLAHLVEVDSHVKDKETRGSRRKLHGNTERKNARRSRLISVARKALEDNPHELRHSDNRINVTRLAAWLIDKGRCRGLMRKDHNPDERTVERYLTELMNGQYLK